MPVQKYKKTLGLYIHIPFCKTICTYCAFLTFAHKNKWIPDYVESLLKEIQLKSSQFKSYQVESIYFGGGTPSLIDSIYIERILQTIKQNFQVKRVIEISLEANPESLTPEKIRHYQQLGINRISLGVQSLNPRTLFKVARPHDEKSVFQALENLQKAKFKNFGMDVIMGLPYQTLAEFRRQLKTLLTYNPTHLSAYFLSYDTKKIDTFIQDSPKEEEQIKMYQYFVQKTKKAGFNHYEVSNYALPGYECKHNQRYWNRGEYLGLGLGAHSFFNEIVCENTRNFDEYLKTPTKFEDSYPLDKDTRRMDLIMLSLRQAKGLNLKSYQKSFGTEAVANLKKNARKYLHTKKLRIQMDYLQPSDSGFLIINKITRDLL